MKWKPDSALARAKGSRVGAAGVGWGRSSMDFLPGRRIRERGQTMGRRPALGKPGHHAFGHPPPAAAASCLRSGFTPPGVHAPRRSALGLPPAAPGEPFRMADAPSMTAAPRGWLERVWSSVADRGRAYADVPAAGLPPLERARRLAQALLSERGEASGAAVARRIAGQPGGARRRRIGWPSCSCWPKASGRTRRSCAPPPRPGSPTPGPEAAARLAAAAEPPRQELLRRMNMAPGGTAALVGHAQGIAGLSRQHPELAAAGCGSAASFRLLVQPRLPRTAPDRLADPGGGAGEADRLRGGARDPRLGRPPPPARPPTAAASPSSIPRCPGSR